eukprot:353037-Chlamydomonas_euryale.AAC.10
MPNCVFVGGTADAAHTSVWERRWQWQAHHFGAKRHDLAPRREHNGGDHVWPCTYDRFNAACASEGQAVDHEWDSFGT